MYGIEKISNVLTGYRIDRILKFLIRFIIL